MNDGCIAICLTKHLVFHLDLVRYLDNISASLLGSILLGRAFVFKSPSLKSTFESANLANMATFI